VAGVIVDIGTGDGSFALSMAKKHPDRYIIGIDPNHQNLAKTSLKSQPSPSKDSLPNLLFVLASVQDLPSQIDGIANQVFINFPWSGLMQSLLLADTITWQNIGRICQPGALIEIIFSYDQVRDAKLGLPQINPDYIHIDLAPRLHDLGFGVTGFSAVSQSELKSFPSSWAKKLAFGKDRTFYHLQVNKA